MTKRSIEEQIEDFFKNQLDFYGVRHFTKTEPVNPLIDEALANYSSKSGGTGSNYPDIKVLLTSKHRRSVPVMIEAKGRKGDLIGLKKGTDLIDDAPGAVKKYAVNGAIHYIKALLENNAYEEGIAIGINGWQNEDGSLTTEIGAYYLSKKKYQTAIKIDDYEDLSFLKEGNISSLMKKLDTLVLSERELEELKSAKESELESKIHTIHQKIYDDRLETALDTNQKLYLFCGLIMAGLSVDGVADLEPEDLKGNALPGNNDGTQILQHIGTFLDGKHTTQEKKDLVIGALKPVFNTRELWQPVNGESYVKTIFRDVKKEIIPCLTSELHLDFTGKIFNKLNDWVHIENDKQNDVVLTPRYITSFMAKLARTDKDSYVWDSAMGSAGFLVSAMELMIADAKAKIKDEESLNAKIARIKNEQILGIEILSGIYLLAVLNMILMGDGASRLLQGDSFIVKHDTFPATVFLLNPPYSAADKGLNFVAYALSRMTRGYGCVLIQENAGGGTGVESARKILKNNTLVASIHMPTDLFGNKASVQTAIYLFKVNQPHDANSLVTFVDMSEDGYTRMNRKKSSQSVNLRDTDHAKERYQEVLDIILNRKKATNFYTEENGLIIKDTVSLDGNDWTFAQHVKVDLVPTPADFKKTVGDYLSWKVSTLLKGGSANFP